MAGSLSTCRILGDSSKNLLRNNTKTRMPLKQRKKICVVLESRSAKEEEEEEEEDNESL
jgi:hypothetical protein